MESGPRGHSRQGRAGPTPTPITCCSGCSSSGRQAVRSSRNTSAESSGHSASPNQLSHQHVHASPVQPRLRRAGRGTWPRDVTATSPTIAGSAGAIVSTPADLQNFSRAASRTLVSRSLLAEKAPHSGVARRPQRARGRGRGDLRARPDPLHLVKGLRSVGPRGRLPRLPQHRGIQPQRPARRAMYITSKALAPPGAIADSGRATSGLQDALWAHRLVTRPAGKARPRNVIVRFSDSNRHEDHPRTSVNGHLRCHVTAVVSPGTNETPARDDTRVSWTSCPDSSVARIAGVSPPPLLQATGSMLLPRHMSPRPRERFPWIPRYLRILG